MWVYVESENWVDDNGERQHLFTVGFYKPNGKFESDSDHNNRGNAACRVNYLNGGIGDDLAHAVKTFCEYYYEYPINRA